MQLNGKWSFRGLEESDYETLVEWWNAYDFPPPPREILPSTEYGLCGIMIEDEEDEEYCAGFVYFTNSPIAWIEFIISNPLVENKELRVEMIRELISKLTDVARDNDARVIFTSMTNLNLKEHFLANDFVVGDEGITQMIKTI